MAVLIVAEPKVERRKPFRVLFVDAKGAAVTEPIGYVAAAMLVRSMREQGHMALVIHNHRPCHAECEKRVTAERIERVTLHCQQCAALSLHLRAIRLTPSDLAAVGSPLLPPELTATLGMPPTVPLRPSPSLPAAKDADTVSPVTREAAPVACPAWVEACIYGGGFLLAVGLLAGVLIISAILEGAAR